MLLPLLFLLLPLLLASPNSSLECFVPRSRRLPPLHPITVRACMETATLLDGDKSRAPMLFSRSPTAGYQVPHRFSGLSACIIDIDVRSEDDEVLLSLFEVAAIAVGVASICSRHSELGGMTWVPDKGEGKEKLVVKVHGVEWPVAGIGAGVGNGTSGGVGGSGMVGDAGRIQMVAGELPRLRLGLARNETRVGTEKRREGGPDGGSGP